MIEYNPLDLSAAQLDALDRDLDRFFPPEPPKPAPCKRCHGTGEIKAFQHVLGGICFRCWGVGEEMSEADRAIAAQAARQLKIFA